MRKRNYNSCVALTSNWGDMILFYFIGNLRLPQFCLLLCAYMATESAAGAILRNERNAKTIKQLVAHCLKVPTLLLPPSISYNQLPTAYGRA